MAVQSNGGSKKKKKPAAKKKTATATKAKTTTPKTTARKKITAEQFAINQLRKAGIKPVKGGDVKAQFRKANAAAAKRRAKAGLGKAATVGAYSALAAGNRTANPKVQQARAAAIKTQKTEPKSPAANKPAAVKTAQAAKNQPVKPVKPNAPAQPKYQKKPSAAKRKAQGG